MLRSLFKTELRRLTCVREIRKTTQMGLHSLQTVYMSTIRVFLPLQRDVGVEPKPKLQLMNAYV